MGEAKTPVLSKEKQWGKLTQSSGVVRGEDERRTETLGKAKPGGARKMESGPACRRPQEHAELRGWGRERGGEGVRNAGKEGARGRRKREACGKEVETPGGPGMPG